MDEPLSIGNSPSSGRSAWRAACLSLAAAVILGAFGAHALERALEVDRLEAYRTASQYHFYSCFFLFAIAGFRERFRENADLDARLARAQRIWGWGTMVFCSSVYLVAVRGLIGLESAGWLGALAPLGGVLLIVGAVLAAAALSRRSS